MTRRSKMFLGLDAFVFVASFLFVLDNVLALRADFQVWGHNLDELGWVRNPLTSITWPPFLGSEHSIPQIFVGIALIGCIVCFLILIGFFVVWILPKGKAILLRGRVNAL